MYGQGDVAFSSGGDLKYIFSVKDIEEWKMTYKTYHLFCYLIS